MRERNYSGKLGRDLTYFERASDPTAKLYILAKPAARVMGVFAQTPVLSDNLATTDEYVCNSESNTSSFYVSESDGEDINPCL
jgi:hypothetical protein